MGPMLGIYIVSILSDDTILSFIVAVLLFPVSFVLLIVVTIIRLRIIGNPGPVVLVFMVIFTVALTWLALHLDSLEMQNRYGSVDGTRSGLDVVITLGWSAFMVAAFVACVLPDKFKSYLQLDRKSLIGTLLGCSCLTWFGYCWFQFSNIGPIL